MLQCNYNNKGSVTLADNIEQLPNAQEQGAEEKSDNDKLNEQINHIIDHYSKKLSNTELELALVKSELAILKKELGGE